MTKLYRNLCEAVVDNLGKIFLDRQYTDKALASAFKQRPQWGGRDRRFIAETTYDIVRWRRYYAALADTEEDNFWVLLGVWCLLHDIPLPEWKEFASLNASSVLKKAEQNEFSPAVAHSIPDWLYAFGLEQLGDRWERELDCLNQSPLVILRVNSLKGNVAALKERLAADGIMADEVGGDHALALRERRNIFTHELFKRGWFELQDISSQQVAPFLRPQAGMRVVDACAGAGGKTLHLAALMGNKGRIIALDTEAWKLEELKKRARRASVSIIETRVIDSVKVIKRLSQSADALLLDAPCSGIGVLRRNPDAKWKLSAQSIAELITVQQKILDQYCGIIKPGGMMVYATCSIFPDENEKQIARFLERNSEFILVDEKRIYPSQNADGFYMALLQRISKTNLIAS